MAVAQRFILDWPEGVEPIFFIDWIKLLPQAEQDEFHQAKIRQESFRQQAVDNGRITTVTGNHYIWKDEQEAKLDKETDAVWERYWNRYLLETKTQFKVVYEEVEDNKSPPLE